MEIVKIRCEGEPVLIKADSNLSDEQQLEFMQEQVGGWIEYFPSTLPKSFNMYIDHDGISKNLKVNEKASKLAPKHMKFGYNIFGNAIIVKISKSKNEDRIEFEDKWSDEDYELIENLLECKLR